MPPLVEVAAQTAAEVAAEDAATALVNNVKHLLIHLIMRLCTRVVSVWGTRVCTSGNKNVSRNRSTLRLL